MNKDQFDALMKLAELRRDRLDKRRDFEWKMSLALWALLAGSAATLKIHSPVFLIPIFFVIVFGHAILWVRPIWVRNRYDLLMLMFYLERCEQLISSEVSVRDRPKLAFDFRTSLGFAGDWAAQFHVLTTVALGIGAYLIIGRSN